MLPAPLVNAESLARAPSSDALQAAEGKERVVAHTGGASAVRNLRHGDTLALALLRISAGLASVRRPDIAHRIGHESRSLPTTADRSAFLFCSSDRAGLIELNVVLPILFLSGTTRKNYC